MTFTLKFDVLQVGLNTSVFLYVLSIFWVESLSGWSRLVHLSVAAMLLCLFFVGWRRGIKIRREPVLLLFWAFMIFAFISIYWSPERGTATVSTVSLLFNILGASLVWIAFWNHVPVRIVGYAAIVGASIQAGVALQQFWAGDGDLLRFEGLTGNANALAIQLSIAAFLVLISLRQSWWPPLIAFLLVIIATILSGSRKIAFVWFIFGLLILRYIGTQFQSSRLFRILLLLGLPILVYGTMSYSTLLLKPIEGLYVYERIQATIQGEESSANLRNSMIREGIALWQASPIYGYGINQYRFVSSYSTYSHNNYTELLVSFGIIGLVLYYSILLSLLFRSARGFIKGGDYAPILGAAVTLLLLWDVALVAYSTRLIWLFIGVLGYLSQQQFSTLTVPIGPISENTKQVTAFSQ